MLNFGCHLQHNNYMLFKTTTVNNNFYHFGVSHMIRIEVLICQKILIEHDIFNFSVFSL